MPSCSEVRSRFLAIRQAKAAFDDEFLTADASNGKQRIRALRKETQPALLAQIASLRESVALLTFRERSKASRPSKST